MTGLPKPHGGRLVNGVLTDKRRETVFEEAYEMPKMEVDQEAILDAEKIAVGAFSPLEGFMERENYENVIYDGQLADGVPWTIPIILAPKRGSGGNEKTIKTVKEGDDIAQFSPS